MKFQARNNYLINWPEYPIIRITVCFMIGIILSEFINIPLVYNIVMLLGILAAFVYFNSKIRLSMYEIRMVSLAVLILGVSLGLFRGNLQNNKNDLAHYLNYLEDENVIIGEVITELKIKESISATLEVKRINGHGCRGQLLVYFNKRDSLIGYKIFDLISLTGKIQFLKDNANPKSFNYKSFLKYKGIDAQIFLKDGRHHLIKSNGSNLISETAMKLRSWALSVFEKRLTNRDQLATASAMVLGYRAHLSEDLYTSFSATGAVHVLAVSGLHVGIICMIFIFVFNRFKYDTNSFKLLKFITLVQIVWIYAMVTGASPAVLRASVMFTFILVGKLWFKGANIYNILAFSALLILMYDPYLLFQLSFQFSYLALMSIVFFQPHIERWYETKHWITTKVWQLTTVSIAAQILIFPISVFYFHKFPTYFILSGIAAVFLATFILGMGLLLLLINGIPVIGDIIAAGYSTLLEFFIWIISRIQALPYNNVDGIYLSVRSVIVLYCLIGSAMFLISLKPNRYKDVFQRKLGRKRLSLLFMAICIMLLFVNSILFNYRVKNHFEWVVYDISNDTVIDIFCGNRLLTLHSENIDIDKINFASRSYRVYHGNPENVFMDNIFIKGNSHLVFDVNGSFIFKNKHILMVDKVDIHKSIPCQSDVLMVANKTNLLPYDLLKKHNTSLVVLDNSLSYLIKNQWIKECKKKGIRVHDIRKDGVFRI